jgi:hypothetical protein
LLISLALDFPNCMTRDPPPCIWLKKNRNSRTRIRIGRKLTSRLTSQLLRGTSSVKPLEGGFSSSRSMSSR